MVPANNHDFPSQSINGEAVKYLSEGSGQNPERVHGC